MRWENYFLRQTKKYYEFWKNYLTADKSVLFVMGSGFDPRMCLGLESILQKCGDAKIDCILIDFVEGRLPPSSDLLPLADQNNAKLYSIMNGRGKIRRKKIDMTNDSGRAVGPRNATEIFTQHSDFENYTDVIVDISSLPLGIYFPLIGKILNILESSDHTARGYAVNLHVIVAESVQIDRCIKKEELPDEAAYLYGFFGSLNLESGAESPLIWIPILGENQHTQIELINYLVSPEEICPILPSPSIDPRRGDKIMLEHRELLIDRLSVETRNIIYGSEQNPFEIYRQICKTVKHYRDALKPLGNTRFAISSLSSKLMSMGAFLVAYEEGVSWNKRVGVAYIESGRYTMIGYDKNLLNSCELFSMWIFGDCYGKELGGVG